MRNRMRRYSGVVVELLWLPKKVKKKYDSLRLVSKLLKVRIFFRDVGLVAA